MIRKKGTLIKMDTPHTSFVVRTEGERAELLYYGRKVRFEPDFSALCAERDFAGNDTPRLLCSSYGSADFREPGIRVLLADGSAATHFRFVRVRRGVFPLPEPLPRAYGEEDCVCFEFADEEARLKLLLWYAVFADTDVIATMPQLVNTGKKDVHIRKIASYQLDLWGEGYRFVTYDGSWGAERQRHSWEIGSTLLCNESRTGSSSPFHNPFVLVEREGEVYAVNLVYSGNHRETAEGNAARQVRLLGGIGDPLFDWTLAPGETFSAPQGVFLFAEDEDKMRAEMHRFVAEHIVRGRWKRRERPVLVNHWEGAYFGFDRARILSMARAAADVGAELFVLDDGWFGHRDDDTSSLGDWFDYEKKTGGLASLAEEIRGMGLKFGIWMEPEMISEDSELYEKHPEFAMKPLRREGTRIRNQWMLNLADKQVQNTIVRAVTRVLNETKAAYVKWDYNRHITDPFGKGVPAGEYAHRYILGLYSVLRRITEKFPLVLFESCASGGGRFDLGMLSFLPQTWASDNTDARERLSIQAGTADAYPPATMGAHVTASPNHQTGNETPLETRFNVACGGLMGYEMDLSRCTEEEREIVRAQIAFYKANRTLLQFGTYYRLDDAFGAGGFSMVSPDRTRAIAVIVVEQRRVGQANPRYRLKGLDPAFDYAVSARRQDNYAEEIAFTAGGDLLMQASFPLQDFFADTKNHGNAVYTRMLCLKKVP